MASWYEQFDRVFEEMDTDKSGYLDEAEVQKALLVSGYSLSAEEAKILFDDMDTSGDGQVSKEEFRQAMVDALEPTAHEEAMLRRTFKYYDKDKNGTIDLQELKLIYEDLRGKISEEKLQKAMKLMDEDQSGTIDIDEFMRAFKMIVLQMT